MLSGKTAVVTGGASGNGREISQTFAEQGADIVVADVRREPRLDGPPTDELVEAETDQRATYVSCDVSNEPDLVRAVDAAEEYGGVDVMVNNAGVIRRREFAETDPEEYTETMNINTFSAFFGTQAAAARMSEDGGAVINVASYRSDLGTGQYVDYCASKGGIKAMTYALADALGPSVRVNSIHPGIIETAQTIKDSQVVGTAAEDEYADAIPRGRIGRPEDVANAALYLASDLADYVTGESLYVDGGLTHTR